MLNLKLLTVAALAAGLALATTPSISTAQQPANPDAKPGTGMMHGDTMAMMGQMNRMMENCNRMMESMMQPMPAKPGAEGPEKKG